ncbi:hypothetical protein [Pedobacter panaciterrae]
MKKQILTLVFILFAISAFSQGSNTSFYGKYVDMYRGKKGIISTEYEKYQSVGIQSRPILEITNVIKKKKTVLDTVVLENPLELIGDTVLFDDRNFDTRKDIFGSIKYQIPFKSIKTGKSYILDYNDISVYEFPFNIIDPLSIPDDFFCSEIRKSEDEFTGKKKIFTPPSDDIDFEIVTAEGKQFCFMTLNAVDNSLGSLGGKGVIVLFQDGTKLTFPDEKIMTNQTSMTGYYSYLAVIRINEEDIKNLQSKKIKGFRLNVIDKMITDFDATRYNLLFKCLTRRVN